MKAYIFITLTFITSVAMFTTVHATEGAYYPEHGMTVPQVAAPYMPSAMDFIGAPVGGTK